MKRFLTSGAILLALAGCGSPAAKGPVATATPVTPSPVPGLTAAQVAALQRYACATIPVTSELVTASSRYDAARAAQNGGLIDTAHLNMVDAATFSGNAQRQLSVLTAPSQLAAYQRDLTRAADEFHQSATALASDYAVHNLTAISTDSKGFDSGNSALSAAQSIRATLSSRVGLPDESSPQCTQSYLNRFLKNHQLAIPTPVPPTPTPAPTSRPTATPTPARTAKPQPTVRPKVGPTIVIRTVVSHAELSYAKKALVGLQGIDAANAELGRAETDMAHRHAKRAGALLDDVGSVLPELSKYLKGIHPPVKRDRVIQSRLTIALSRSTTVLRKLRLTMLDLVANDLEAANADSRDAIAVLRRALDMERSVRRAINRL